jgi:hypothetical protein
MSDEMERAREWLMKPENWQRIMLRLRAMHDGKSPSAQELYAFLAPVLAAYAREREQWVSVETALPEIDMDVLWAKFGENMEVDRITERSHPEDFYTHWRELPAPPEAPQP